MTHLVIKSCDIFNIKIKALYMPSFASGFESLKSKCLILRQ